MKYVRSEEESSIRWVWLEAGFVLPRSSRTSASSILLRCTPPSGARWGLLLLLSTRDSRWKVCHTSSRIPRRHRHPEPRPGRFLLAVEYPLSR